MFEKFVGNSMRLKGMTYTWTCNCNWKDIKEFCFIYWYNTIDLWFSIKRTLYFKVNGFCVKINRWHTSNNYAKYKNWKFYLQFPTLYYLMFRIKLSATDGYMISYEASSCDQRCTIREKDKFKFFISFCFQQDWLYCYTCIN